MMNWECAGVMGKTPEGGARKISRFTHELALHAFSLHRCTPVPLHIPSESFPLGDKARLFSRPWKSAASLIGGYTPECGVIAGATGNPVADRPSSDRDSHEN